MADPVLTTAATVQCAFQGTVAVANPGTVKLTVGGSPVAVASGVSGWSVTGCKASTSSGNSPCSTVSTPTAGTAGKLVVGGAAVLLKTFVAATGGSAVPHRASVTQVASTRLTAV